ncbi:hypothetical protein [Tardiphaga sp.]|uniref:hypothetical protein n=1 Tax=Tardiphaga sp. TaxID=1926292 RepID=UPI00261003FD|nr:hypothetical protein [Tardiphaga sp.]MDB5616991.1 hypothetical protein [Tardiphaga sp.]
MKTYLLAVSLVLAAAPAFAACTEQQVSDKAMQVSAKLETLTAKDPKKAEEVMMKMVAAQSDPKATASVDAMCKSYDDLLAEIAKIK